MKQFKSVNEYLKLNLEDLEQIVGLAQEQKK